jgi:rhodanese-related sulfurtransferase
MHLSGATPGRACRWRRFGFRPEACKKQRDRSARAPPARRLEWRCDPASRHREPRIDARVHTLILICDEGYQSSLAAATLHDLGPTRTTDVIGGFRAWRGAGLAVEVTTPR